MNKDDFDQEPTWRARRDPLEDTRPVIRSTDHLEEFQPIQVERRPRRRRRFRLTRTGLKFILFLLVALATYLLAPFRTNILVLGIDRVPEGTTLGRSDTMILTSVQPWSGAVGMLSIPRDLWVAIPGYGEQRINAAHYFAEGAEAGSGPAKAMETVEYNFGVPVHYFLRFRLEGFADVIDAFGGIHIELAESTGNYDAGEYNFTGEEALAFVRDRTGDDFFRMEHAQVFIRAGLTKMLNPLTWFRVPGTLLALGRAVDTDIPGWQWPRLGLALLRAGPGGIDTRSLDRTMAYGWVTADGANVLLPDWTAINPLLEEMFGVR